MAQEPSIRSMANPLVRYFAATRPAFLTVTLVGCLIGLASARFDGIALHASTAIVTLIFALVAHAAVNVLNDYYDALNGTDARNTQRLYPFTGGSRFIQNGVLSERATARFGSLLILLVIAAGLWLMARSAAGLLWIGLAGLFVGWAYSAPPFKLNSRGLGEGCVWMGFALIAVGTDFVQRGSASASALVNCTPYALLVTNLLFINQFPDRAADEVAGKHHWVVRLGPARASRLYAVIALVAYGWLIVCVLTRQLPSLSLLSLLPALLSLSASSQLIRHADTPARLGSAIRMTIAAALAHGTILAAVLALHRLSA